MKKTSTEQNEKEEQHFLATLVADFIYNKILQSPRMEAAEVDTMLQAVTTNLATNLCCHRLYAHPVCCNCFGQ